MRQAGGGINAFFFLFQLKPFHYFIIQRMSPVPNPTVAGQNPSFSRPHALNHSHITHHIHSRKVKRFLGTDPQKAACLRPFSSRKNDGSSPASWPSAVLTGAARGWQGIHPGEFLLSISLEPSGQAGVGQVMCQVTRARCYHIFGGDNM